MILVDANVLLRSAKPRHSQYGAAKAAVTSARRRGYAPCIVPQVIYEYWVVATRPIAENGLGMTTAEAETDIAQIIEQFHLFEMREPFSIAGKRWWCNTTYAARRLTMRGSWPR
jgi:hypothetical protein